MGQVLVRNLDHKTILALKRRAEDHDRSLQQELKSLLEDISRYDSRTSELVARRIRTSLKKKGIPYSDSGQLQAEDRLR